MALFPSLPAEAHLSDVLQRFPDNAGPLMIYLEGILRAEGELTIGERELIASYVSGLNACTFCYGSHRVYSEVFGIPRGVVDAVLKDIDTADIAARMKPILKYVGKLTRLPSRLVQADADVVFAAGWSEAALFEAVQVCAAFNMMNRIVEGAGVTFDYDKHDDVRRELRNRRQHSYLDFGRRLGVIPPEDESLDL
ncbi:MAG: peroxidase-related enzyme [Rhodobacteraceae bacterium]|nr:peroxidase-related enzyme [Paracoccaceae bacterium]